MVHRGQLEGQEHVAVIAIFVQLFEQDKANRGIVNLFKTSEKIDGVECT